MTTCLKPIVENNRFYDPPADLTSSEVQAIAGATRNQLSIELDNLARLMVTIREKVDVTEDEADAAEEREMAQLQQLYKLHARFTVSPIPWSFFHKIYRSKLAEGKGL